jgi:hypothetical protein
MLLAGGPPAFAEDTTGRMSSSRYFFFLFFLVLVRHLLGPHALAEDKWADVVCGAACEEGGHKVVGV